MARAVLILGSGVIPSSWFTHNPPSSRFWILVPVRALKPPLLAFHPPFLSLYTYSQMRLSNHHDSLLRYFQTPRSLAFPSSFASLSPSTCISVSVRVSIVSTYLRSDECIIALPHPFARAALHLYRLPTSPDPPSARTDFDMDVAAAAAATATPLPP
ncbi:hypothetical protein BD414DRAFT_540841 [Trametes punicea]|nr:hypothetical protein BD414DRAFT_540841 [Trametes punicea]